MLNVIVNVSIQKIVNNSHTLSQMRHCNSSSQVVDSLVRSTEASYAQKIRSRSDYAVSNIYERIAHCQIVNAQFEHFM